MMARRKVSAAVIVVISAAIGKQAAAIARGDLKYREPATEGADVADTSDLLPHLTEGAKVVCNHNPVSDRLPGKSPSRQLAGVSQIA